MAWYTGSPSYAPSAVTDAISPSIASAALAADRHHRGIVGQQAGDDLAAAGVHSKVQFALGATRPAVLLLIPLALADQLQAGAVDHQMQRAMRDDFWLPSGEAAAAPAQGRVARDAQRLFEQQQHTRGGALSLAQG